MQCISRQCIQQNSISATVNYG